MDAIEEKEAWFEEWWTNMSTPFKVFADKSECKLAWESGFDKALEEYP